MFQEWKLNIDASEYEQNIDANLYKPPEKKKFNFHDSDAYWPTSIKDTIKWFPFLTIMEHTANMMGKRANIIIIKGICHI